MSTDRRMTRSDWEKRRRNWSYCTNPGTCPLCDCKAFDAGYIEQRLMMDHTVDSDYPHYKAMKQELKEDFNLIVSEKLIEQHWKLHVVL